MNKAFISMATSLAELIDRKIRVHQRLFLTLLVLVIPDTTVNCANHRGWKKFQILAIIYSFNTSTFISNRRLWTLFFLPKSWASDVAMLMNASFIASNIVWVTLLILFLVGDGHLSIQNLIFYIWIRVINHNKIATEYDGRYLEYFPTSMIRTVYCGIWD